MPGSSNAPATGLTIEAIVAVESPREFRLHPRDRVVAYTAEAAGARQLFTLPLRGGTPTQVTASEKAVSEPAVVARRPPPRVRPRRGALGRRGRWLAADPGRRPSPVARSQPRWSPDGRRLAFLSRRRGWSQVWVIDAPVPAPRPAGQRAEAARAVGRDRVRRRRRRVRVGARRRPARGHGPADARGSRDVPDRGSSTSPPARPEVVAGERQPRHGRALAAGRLAALRLGCRRLVPGGPADRRRPRPDRPDRGRARARRAVGRHRASRRSPRRTAAGSSTSRSTTACRTSSSATSAAARAQARTRPAAEDAADRRRPPPTGRRINPWDGVWRSVGWLADGAWVAAIGESETQPQDLWLLPVPGVGAGRRPAAPGHRLAAGRPRRGARAGPGRRPASGSPFTARDGLRVEGTLWRPVVGDRQARRPARPDRSSTRTAARPWQAFADLPAVQAAASPTTGSRSSTSTSAARPGTGGRSATPTTASGATPTSTT